MSEKETDKEVTQEVQPVEKEPSESEEDLKKKIAELEQDKTNLVGEIKSVREEKGKLKEDVETLQQMVESKVTQPEPTPTETTDVENTVNSILANREASRAKNNRKLALEKFVSENKEFHPDNDPTGLKRDALEKALSRFNQEGVTEVEDFTQLIKDASSLLGRKDTTAEISKDKEIPNPYASSSSSQSIPTVAADEDLSLEEKRVIESHGFSKEKFLRLKARYPEYIDGLLNPIPTQQ